MHLSRTYLDMKKQWALEENLLLQPLLQLIHVFFLETAWGRAPQLNCSVHTGFPMNPYVPIPIQVTRNIPETGLKGCALPCFHCLKDKVGPRALLRAVNPKVFHKNWGEIKGYNLPTTKTFCSILCGNHWVNTETCFFVLLFIRYSLVSTIKSTSLRKSTFWYKGIGNVDFFGMQIKLAVYTPSIPSYCKLPDRHLHGFAHILRGT